MTEACKDADVIYAKSGARWSTTPTMTKAKLQDCTRTGSWTSAKLELAKPDAIYMHPLPADRNIEVTDAVIDGAAVCGL